jgi:hypothetical protein
MRLRRRRRKNPARLRGKKFAAFMLRARRAKDEQVYCFQLGEFLVVCPMPTPEEKRNWNSPA